MERPRDCRDAVHTDKFCINKLLRQNGRSAAKEIALITSINRLWGWVCLLTLLAGASLLAAPQEQSLQYHSQLAQRRSMLDVMGSRSLNLSEKAPDGVQLPQFQCKQPFFAQWTSPMAQKGRLLIVLDRTQEKGPYDRMFIDLNEDGHLKDETAISAGWTSSESATFGPIELNFADSEKSIKYHLNFEFFSYEDTRDLTVVADGQYEGTIQVGAEEKYCILIDYYANGAFNDVALDARQSDRIQIGKPNDRNSLKTGYVGKFIEIDEQLYELEVALSGSYIKLTPARGVTFGMVELSEDITEFAAGGENGLFTFRPEKGQVELPVGKYHIEYWTMLRQDEKGDQWKLQGAEFGGRGDFEVGAETKTILLIGEPITCRLDIVNTGPATYTLNQIFKGQLDESIILTCNEALPGDLEIHVKNADGSYVKTEFLEDA